MHDSSRSSWSSLKSTLPERNWLMLGWRTPLRRDSSDCVVLVWSITSRRTSLRSDTTPTIAKRTMGSRSTVRPSLPETLREIHVLPNGVAGLRGHALELVGHGAQL